MPTARTPFQPPRCSTLSPPHPARQPLSPRRRHWLHLFAALALAASLALPAAEPAAAAPATSLLNAQMYWNEGNLRASLIEVQNVLRDDPQNADARLLLARLYLRAEQGAAAAKELERAKALGAPAPAIPALMAEALFLQADYGRLLRESQVTSDLPAADQAAIYALGGLGYLNQRELLQAGDLLQRASLIQADHPWVLLGQASVALARNDPAQARQRLEQLVKTNPAFPRAWRMLGALELVQGHREAAEAAYSKAVEYSLLAGESHLKRALLRVERGDYAGAESDIAAVRQTAPNHPGPLLVEGMLRFHQQRYPEAVTAFDQVLKSMPDNVQALYFRGASHYAQNQLQQAVSDLSQMLGRMPDSEPARRMLSAIYLRLQQYDQAESTLKPLLQEHPDDIAVLDLMARIRMAQDRREEANAYLEQILALQPDAALPRARLGFSLLQEGATDEAVTELEKAISLDPKLYTADITLILTYLQAGKLDSALQAAARLQQKQPDQPRPWVFIGTLHLLQKDGAAAQAAFQQALKLQPGMPEASAWLAELALRAGQVEPAREYLQAVLAVQPEHLETRARLAALDAATGHEDTARQSLEQLITQRPELLNAYLILARLHLRNQQPNEALKVLERIPPAPAGHPAARLALAEAQLRTSNPNTAIVALNRLIQEKPALASAHYLLAQAHGATGKIVLERESLYEGLRLQPGHPQALPLVAHLVAQNPEQAQLLFKDLQKALPDHPLLFHLEGQLALQRGHLSQAVAVYRQAHQRFPDDVRWVLTLAEAQQQAFDPDSAETTLQQWLQAHPDDALVQFQLAESYLRRQEYDKARPLLAGVVERAPNNALALNNLAWLLRKDDPQQALDYAERANRLSNRANFRDTLGVILLEQGQTQRAVQMLREAVEQQPDDPTFQYHLAQALVQTGDSSEARRLLRHLLDGKTAFADREGVAALLKQLGDTAR